MTSLRRLAESLFSPLQVAAYLAWATVWLSCARGFAQYPDWAPLLHAMLPVFLLLFVSCDGLHQRFGAWAMGLAMACMAAISLLASALVPFSAAPILLVLLGAVLATQLDGARLALAIVLQGVALAVIAIVFWPGGLISKAISVLAYASFVAFAALVMRMAVRAEALAQRLQEANSELTTTRSLLAEGVRESERLRLSRELHDVAGHTLTALKLNLGALQRDPSQPDPERISLCAGLADELLQNLRGVVRQQRRHEGLDIAAGLARLAEPFPRPKVELDVQEGLRISGLERAEAVLRMVQEGLTNAARHSDARRVKVSLHRDGDLLRLRVQDDGRLTAMPTPGHGLQGMRERLEAVGGRLDVDRGEQGGLRLEATLPAGER